jgi:hypothetical protein
MLKVLIVVAALGDVVTFYATLAGFFRQYGSVVLWGLTLALACASVGLMHSAGEALKNLREARGGHGRVVIIFLVLGWLVVGGVAVAFRLLGSSSVSGATSGFGADRSAETAAAAQDALLSAVLLAGLFFASGLLAFYAGFAQHHPRMKAYRSLVAGLPQQAEKVALLQATAERVDRALEHARDGEQRAAQHAEDSIAAADAEIDALKEWVRVSIAGHLGTPEATTGLVVGRADQYATAAPSSPRPLGEDPSPPGDGDVPAPHGPPPPPPSPLGLWAVPVAVAPNGHQPNGHGSSTGQL